jgi:glutaredoxin
MIKYVIAFLLVVGLIQNWGKIERKFQKKPVMPANTEVVLYATAWCGYCRQTRAFLEKNDIAYTEYDIEKSDLGRKQYRELEGRGIPLMSVNGTIVRGYDPEGILAALGRSQ